MAAYSPHMVSDRKCRDPETFTAKSPTPDRPARPGLAVTSNTDTPYTSSLQTIKAAGITPIYDLKVLDLE